MRILWRRAEASWNQVASPFQRSHKISDIESRDIMIDASRTAKFGTPPSFAGLAAKLGFLRKRTSRRIRHLVRTQSRSEERRVGKAGVSKCRTRWWPDHK